MTKNFCASPKNFRIEETPVGEGEPSYIVAEVGQAHDGSLRTAHSFIDAVAGAGANAVKFQMHLPAAESTLDEQFRVPMGGQDSSRFDYWARTGFSTPQWKELRSHASDVGLGFLCSPFSLEAVEALDDLNISAWKVASPEVTLTEMLDRLPPDSKPIILSTGLSTYSEIRNAIWTCRKKSQKLALLQCTTMYPTPFKLVGLNVIEELREFDVLVGLSDHSGSIYPGLAAIGRGASILEVHVTFHRGLDGPDSTSSITFEQLAVLTEARDAIHEMDSNPIDKDQVNHGLMETRNLFGRSVCLLRNMERGSKLTGDDLVPKKPGLGGIPWGQMNRVVGRSLRHDVSFNRLLTWDDLT
jgi:N,N'-diacetyllegionaminate synthase